MSPALRAAITATSASRETSALAKKSPSARMALRRARARAVPARILSQWIPPILVLLAKRNATALRLRLLLKFILAKISYLLLLSNAAAMSTARHTCSVLQEWEALASLELGLNLSARNLRCQMFSPQESAITLATRVHAGTVSVSSKCATPMPTAITQESSSALDPMVIPLFQRPASGEMSSEERY